jgi:hypothetical protein
MKQSILPIGTWSVFVLTLLVSCSPTKKARTYDYDYLYINKQGIVQRPLIVDLEVGKKASITKTYKNVTTDMARQNTIEDFIRQNNADVIVQPLFTINTEDNNTKTTVTVTLSGYPANYKNFRPYEAKDKELLIPKEYLLLPGDYPSRSFSAAQTTETKKGTGGKVLAGTAVLGGLIYGISKGVSN